MDDVALASKAEQNRLGQLTGNITQASLTLAGLCYNCSEPVDAYFVMHTVGRIMKKVDSLI